MTKGFGRVGYKRVALSLGRAERTHRDRIPEGREAVSWEKSPRLLVINRLLEPGSEFRVHRHWFVESAMDALLESDFQAAGKHRVLEHKHTKALLNNNLYKS